MASAQTTTSGFARRDIRKAPAGPPQGDRATGPRNRGRRHRLIPSLLAIGFALAGWSEAAAARANEILRIAVAGEGLAREVRIVTSSEPTFTVFRLSDPMRVVVDISGGQLSSLDTPIVVEDGVIGHIAARQFNADGFLVGRVIVGFEVDLSYDVRAEGNAVVVRTDRSSSATVDRATPPPVAPVDRAAAERFVTAKQEAEAAARRAVVERQQAERSAANARLQQQEAERLAAKARDATTETDRARAEVEKLRQRVQEAAARDKAVAEASARDAERHLVRLQKEAQRVAAARAAAESTAHTAEQARREAEEIAARAEADHKKRVAQLEAEVARAAKEKEAAKQAWDRANVAKREAEAAERRAEHAKRQAESHRAEIDEKLSDVSRREREVAMQRDRAAGERADLEKKQTEIAARDREIEKRSAALAAAGRDVKADRRKIAAERAELSKLREALHQEKTRVASEHGALDRSRKQIEAQWGAIAAERMALTHARDDLQKEKGNLGKRRTEVARLEASVKKRRTDLAADEAILAATQQSLDRDRKALVAAENRVKKGQAKGSSRSDRERRALAQEKARLGKEAKRLASLGEKSTRERHRLAQLREGLAAEQARLGKDRQVLAKDEQQLAHRQHELEGRANATQARASVPVAALIAPEQQQAAVASVGHVERGWSSRHRGGRASLVGVERRGSGDGASILLALHGTPEYQVQRIVDPPRLVIDFLDTTRGTERATFGVQSTYVRRVRLGDHGSMLRAVLDLSANNAAHHLTETADGLLVSLRTVAPQPSARPALQPTAKASGGTLALRDVRFAGNNDVARIVLDIDHNIATRVDDRSARAWVLELDNATVPKSLERSLDTSAYGTVVRLVSTYQARPGAVKVVANLTGPATQKVVREGDGLVWEIRGTGERRTVAAAAAPRAAGFAADAAVLARSTPKQTRRSKRISIDLKDADIVNVLRLLSEVSGENIITSDEVTGKITLRLRNVPWDRALDTILKSKGYDMVRQDNILRIAPAEVIQQERERELDKRNAKAKVEDTVIKIITVNYATASDISGQLQPMLSARGSVQVDNRTNTIVVEDIRSNIDRVVQLTRRLDKQTPQVLIEARIVEASTNQLEHLGIQWGGTSQQSTVTGNPTGLLFPSDIIASGAADDANRNQGSGVAEPSRYAINLPAPIGSGSGGGIGFVFGSAGGTQILNLRLTALEESGKGRIISSPRITTLDNRKATISQGVDIPISVVSAAGVSTRFIQARLKLEVTPHVTNDGSVLMKIAAEKNEPDFANKGGAGDPSIIKKEAVTEVLVRDGETTVIGGIYTRNTSEVESGIPFLSKIPLLGALFRSSRSEDKRSEMLIFVTPRIVNREASAIGPSKLGTPKE